jgi:hypothetical protein
MSKGIGRAERVETADRPPIKGVMVPVNCPHCGAELSFDASSAGREEVRVCKRVTAALSCAPCRARYVLMVELLLAGGSPYRNNGPETTKRAYKPRGEQS